MKMKKIWMIMIVFMIMMNIHQTVIEADGHSISGSDTINLYEGSSQNVTITYSNAAGTVSIKSANSNVASVNTNGGWLESSSMTISIKGVKEGTTTITISGVYAGFNDAKDVSFSKTITVHVYKKTTTNPSIPTTPSKSSVKLLGSLTIDDLQLEEEFNSSLTQYTVYAPINTQKVNIHATPASSKAKLSEIASDVTEGWNEIQFDCIAEDGSKQTYTIRIYVEEKPDIYFNDGKLGVVKNLDKANPSDGFKIEEYQWEGQNIPLFSNNGLSLIYLMNEEYQKDFYVFDKQTNTILCLYQPIEMDGKKYVALPFDYDDFKQLDEQYMHSITYIDNGRYLTWTSRANNMSDFRIFYLLNEQGEKGLYCYDMKEKTLQRFILPVYPIVSEKKTFWEEYQNIICLSSAIAGLLTFVSAIVITSKKR